MYVLDPADPAAVAVARMYTMNPSVGECFYVRLLLSHVRGAHFYKDLRAAPHPDTGELTEYRPFRGLRHPGHLK